MVKKAAGNLTCRLFLVNASILPDWYHESPKTMRFAKTIVIKGNRDRCSLKLGNRHFLPVPH